MIYVASLLGYGDSLITGAVLESAPDPLREFLTVGTAVTSAAWGFLRSRKTPDQVLFDHLPDFYWLRNVKRHGLKSLVQDSKRLHRWATSLHVEDTIILERPAAFRHRLLFGSRARGIVEIPRRQGAYLDRSAVLRTYLGIRHSWWPAPQALAPAKHLVINPTGKARWRRLQPDLVARILGLARASSCSVTLIDVGGCYGRLEKHVDLYMRGPPLPRAVEMLRDADRYMGPDSFFTHLAYYLNVPQMSLFWRGNTYFIPPGLHDTGGVMFEDELANEEQFEERVTRFLNGAVESVVPSRGDKSAL